MTNNHLTKSNIEFSTLVELLQHRARHQADQTVYTFLGDGETEQARLSYRDLDHQARAIAAWLQSQGATGERVLLLYPAGLDYIAAFFGSLYAGCVAVPAYPPRRNRPDSRLEAIVADSQARVVLTTAQILAGVERRLTHIPALATLQWLASDSLAGDGAEAWSAPPLSGETLAYLQYTSGSTSTPKGVMVSHKNLLHTLEDLDAGWEHSPESKLVTWLPHFHDMGLIYGILQPVYKGFPCYMMPPIAFIQQPIRWLQAISRYQATHSGAPNFAYDLCVHKITTEQCATLDLSSWEVALNGAEPIRKESMDQFYRNFAPYGFQWHAFCPGYGLAEATLKVVASRKAEAPVFYEVEVPALEQNRVVEAGVEDPNGQTLVGCGRPMLDMEVVIAQPESLTRCSPDEVGEIWIASTSVAQGYWEQVEATAHTFGAYLADTGEGPFLRTGDLGFLKDGELFVTGRLKDLIIIRGRNVYPQDIELTVEQSHPALRPGCGAAFSIEVNGGERLVTVQEVKREYRQPDIDDVARAIRGAVVDDHELQIYAVVLVKPGTISKTSSGKIQRQASRAQFLAGSLDVVGSSILDDSYFERAEDGLIGLGDSYIAPRTPTEEMLTEIWAEVLGLDLVGITEDFFELGGHSLLATQLSSRISEVFKLDIPLRTLFEAPTIAALAERIGLARGVSQASQVPPILPVSRDQELFLSFSQERMWFLYQFEPNSAAYHIPLAIQFRGPLNVAGLEQSFNEVVRRHESLRTTFANEAGRPVQIIAPSLTLKLQAIDLQDVPQAERETEARRRATQEIRQPFDLAKGPLLRATLFQLAREEHILLMVMHHIISDAWSFGVLWQEIALLYEAFTAGRPASLPELPIQYADFSAWQRQWLQGEALESQLAYWKRQLDGAPMMLELPTDHPRPAVQTFDGEYQPLPLSDSLVEALRNLSHQEGVTLFMLLLAAFNALIYRYTGQEDILVGTPIANRHWLAIEGLIGTFVNTLVMRTDLSGNPTFRELLERVHQTALEAYAHQDLPFEQLVDELQPDRDLSHTPLIQVMFSVANVPMPTVHFPNLSWNVFPVDRGAAQFDLALFEVDTKQIQMKAVEYNTDLFDHATISRMMGHFRVLLENLVAAGLEQRLSDLPLLSGPEQRQLLAGWNQTHLEYPRDRCLHQLIEAQAKRTPEAVAVVFEGEQLTYLELDRRANELARHLQRLGVGPDVAVGIYLERSLELMIGVLAILKAGGCYVPMDPAFPRQRLAFMLEDSQARVLLTQESLSDHLPDDEVHVVCLDVAREAPSETGATGSRKEVSPENLAYVIYTSGSTGIPKGVEIPHGAVVNFLTAMGHQPGLTAQDTMLAVTTLSFDIAVLELFLPLTVGARVEVVSREVAADGLQLMEKVTNSGATIMQATPATWRMLLEAGWPGSDHLKILCGGEALPPELAQQLLERGAGLWNMYGPTETTIWSTIYEVESGDGPVSIGRPIANTQLYILDAHLQPVPVGVAGELYIGGDGLARGYHNRPNLTAEKFVLNPLNGGASERLYKTGDLARYRPDGNLEFLGRIDHQVKLRGFRIELGEIEAVLEQQQAVREAVVIVREDIPGDKRLVAYLVMNQGDSPTVSDLRRHVGEKLPDYMTPSVFMMLEALPLTPNGKVDRRALPMPDQLRPELAESFAAPDTFIEEQLVEIWSQLLGLDQIGIYDNFFELGGHSLLVTQVMSRVREAFQLELPIRNFFEAPTVAGLAIVIEKGLIAEIDELAEEQAQRLVSGIG